MRKLVSGTAVAALAVLFLAGLTTDELKPPFDRAEGLASRRHTLVLVDFATDWCGWCRKLETDVYPEPAVARQLSRVVYLRLDAEREGEALAQRYGVDGFPTLLFLTPSGEVAGRIVGYLPPPAFEMRARSIIDASRK